jgi:hypothetical protein
VDDELADESDDDGDGETDAAAEQAVRARATAAVSRDARTSREAVIPPSHHY